jgi:hypothetical protein
VLLAGSVILEAITGLVLIIAPSVVRFLVGSDISGAALVIVRGAGAGLLLLGIACWPLVEATVPRLRAMLIYNLSAAAYLGYLLLGTDSVGQLLLPHLQSTRSWQFCLSESPSDINLFERPAKKSR